MGRMFVRGDTHGNFDWLDYFCQEYKTTVNDVIVILGDAGINFYGEKSQRELALKKMISEYPVSLFCVRGNHEARPNSRSKMELNWTKAGDIEGLMYYEEDYPNIKYAVDGGGYTFHNRTILTIGGAYSVDKYYRLMNHWTWFENEQLDMYERAYIYEDVKGKHFDYVFTHTCPYSWQPTDLFLQSLDQSTVDNIMERWLEKLSHEITFKHWYFGHYHADRFDVCGDGKVHMLFNEFIEPEIFDYK